MSPTVKSTYSRQEILQTRGDFEGWRWTAGSVEPDGRITVLCNELPGQEMRGFLCRCQHGWFWAANAVDLAAQAEMRTPFSWNAATRDLGGDAMRIPTEDELLAGGWHITNATKQPDEEVVDEAKRLLDLGLNLLETPRPDMATQCKTENHFLASIAVSLYELVALHKKYDFENVVDKEATAEQTEDPKQAIEPESVVDSSAHRVGSDEFPYAR